jgi:hypothetical protein
MSTEEDGDMEISGVGIPATDIRELLPLRSVGSGSRCNPTPG